MISIIDIKKINHKYFKNSNDIYNIHLIKEDFKTSDSSIFVTLPNLYEAQKYYDYLNNALDKDSVLFYPVDQMLTTLMALGSFEFQSERLYTLKKLLTGDKFIVVTTMDGLKTRQLKPIDYTNSILRVQKGNTYEIETVVNYLVNSGYVNSYIVENPGTFSVKGGIIDIFLRDSNNPYRLDFFDNYLESIKVFDVESQRSFANIEYLEITPLHELFYTKEMLLNAIDNINNSILNKVLSKEEHQRLQLDLINLEERSKLSTLNVYIPFFNKNKTTVLDFAKDYKLYVIDEHKIDLNEKQKLDDLNSFKQTMHGDYYSKIPYYLDYKEVINLASVNIDNLGIKHLDGYNLNVSDATKYNNNLDLLYYELTNTYKNYDINFVIGSENNKKTIKEYLDEHNFNNYKFADLSNLGSYIDHNNKVLYLDENSIFNKKGIQKANYRSVLNQTTKVRNVDDLEVGDFVVHYDFGIGQYMGLKTMDLSNIKKDYLTIIYKDNESLYVPIDQISLILKYSTKEGVTPELSKMGSKKWSNTKLSVKKKIVELKDRLLNLYALRDEAVGYAFDKDNEMQKSFEQDFLYDLTLDQEKSINKTKELMEKPLPMDLVLIGDVGFGKTEVALRAAFKAVLSGKQVLYLVPTTILARQHYYTFKERFEKYGGIVKLMNRFVGRKEQNKTIEQLKTGYVDVVIGTHRLLSKDIEFKDLGLFVIDEEQRFGVLHKERIKEIKVNVDTLTLSATPIPRTLQMTMMGIKDLATIETPPLNRYPVQTYVVPRDDALTKEAIRREIARGGQTFYLYNKVDDIELIVLKLQRLVPEAKITFAHGKMSKVQMENTIKDFIDHEYDILVATTIIETGIDIPNTNTLIIHDADKLGLSQLYQIRGRVGRSDKIAYAYLMYERNKSLNDEAFKRLKALEEFTELGSGYKIALKDLSIRGAGDILGSEQSGFIDSVGFEMYMQLLDEVLHDKPELKVDTDNNNAYTNQTINESYVRKDSIRIEIHKKISKLNSIKDLFDLKNELEDRFGKLDEDLLVYMYEKLYNKLSSKLGVYKTNRFKDGFEMIMNKEVSNNLDGQILFEFISKYEDDISLKYVKEEVSIKVKLKNNDAHWLIFATNFLESYKNVLKKT